MRHAISKIPTRHEGVLVDRFDTSYNDTRQQYDARGKASAECRASLAEVSPRSTEIPYCFMVYINVCILIALQGSDLFGTEGPVKCVFTVVEPLDDFEPVGLDQVAQHDVVELTRGQKRAPHHRAAAHFQQGLALSQTYVKQTGVSY